MARTKLNERSANRVPVPIGATGSRPPPSKISVAVLAISIVTAIWAAAMMTPFGRVGYYYFFIYNEFYMGVLTLVSLSITVMLGLVATDRLVLSIRQRVLLQSAHRTTGVIAVAALFIHVTTKTSAGKMSALDAFVPFLAGGSNAFYIGLGTLAGWLLVSVLWTGLARAKFAGRGKPWMWRSVHSAAYLAWPIALVHGLSAGRAAATWVIVSYVVCVIGVLVGLAVRLSVSLNRKKDFSSTSTGALKPVGSLVPTQTQAPKKRTPRRREPEVAESVAAPETWVPAAGARASMSGDIGPISGRPVSGAPMTRPVSASPMPSRPVSASPMPSRPVSSRPAAMPVSAVPYDDEIPVPRSRRYAEEDVAPRRRSAEADRFDEPTRSISRGAMDDEAAVPRGRRRAEIQDEPGYAPEPPARTRRYAEEDDDYAPRPRRAAEDAPRARRYAADDEPAPRARRYAEDDEPPRGRRHADDPYDEAPRPRREPDVQTTGEFRTGGFRYDEAQPAPRRSRSSRYAEDEEEAPRARRDRGADVDRADSGRHSRSDFADLADADYLEPDDTPTLIDIASRRARRQAQPDTTRTASRGARKGGGRGRNIDDALDDQQYWRQLRGEAQ